MGLVYRPPISGVGTFSSAKFGDVAGGNYAEFESDGTLKLNGDATVWDDQQVSIGRVRLGASAPSWTPYKGSEVLAFDPGQDNAITFIIQYSHRLKTGEAIEFHLHTTFPDNNSGDARWVLTVSFADLAGIFPAETSYTYLQAVAANSQDKHVYADVSSNIGSTSGVSGFALCSLTRTGTHVDDDYGADVYLLGLDAHIKIDTMGSREETTK